MLVSVFLDKFQDLWEKIFNRLSSLELLDFDRRKVDLHLKDVLIPEFLFFQVKMVYQHFKHLFLGSM